MYLNSLIGHKAQLTFHAAHPWGANAHLWGRFGPLVFPWISELIRNTSKGQRTV